LSPNWNLQLEEQIAISYRQISAETYLSDVYS